ncbi:hypothetical protein [Bacillus sp. Marseille-Q3570]|uniref:hypothetical protein n=1 Tax=Bacillus sp. Marseille-Q3570 TaxID=2963522 RepID=UPI0021B74629|nr:hypothetical protein [Bacillus sp. Marseille-Q3570]
MMNFYSIETEVKYRKEQLNKSLPRVHTNEQQTAWFKLKELYSRFTSPKTTLESRSKCNYESVCC